jgi:hypothetical protein
VGSIGSSRADLRILAENTGVSATDIGRIIAYFGTLTSKGATDAKTYSDLVGASVADLEALRVACRDAISEASVPPRFPAHVQIQTIAGCNASCVMCAMSVPSIRRMQRGAMSTELFGHIVEECAASPECEEIALYLQNEPLLDRGLASRITTIKEASKGRLRVRIVTNGSLLSTPVIDDLIAAGLDSIAISLNAHRPETYRRTMGGLDYAETVRNIELLIDKAPPSLFVSLTFIVISGNEDEIKEAISYWSERKVYCGAYGVNTHGGALVNFDSLQPRNTAVREKECYLPFESIGILATGDVILCCTDWQRLSLSGSLSSGTIKSIWHAPAVSQFRREALDRLFHHPMCASCLGQTRLLENLLYESGKGAAN